MRLEKGKWYKWLGEDGGVALVEVVGQSSARIKIVTGKLVKRDFETRDGEDVHFSSFKTKRTNISPTSDLEPATENEVAKFVRHHKVIPVKGVDQ